MNRAWPVHGSVVLAGCHAGEYTAWKGSDHALAMQRSNAQTALGDFGNATLAA